MNGTLGMACTSLRALVNSITQFIFRIKACMLMRDSQQEERSIDYNSGQTEEKYGDFTLSESTEIPPSVTFQMTNCVNYFKHHLTSCPTSCLLCNGT